MNEEYDVIILGTGLKESILGALLVTNGKKVLFIDKNSSIGSESASMKLKDVFAKFKPEFSTTGTEIDEQKFGKSSEYNIDLFPKFIMGSGKLVTLLVYTKAA